MLKKLLLFFCVSYAAQTFAQQYPFVHYTPKEGLINSRIRKAFQDSEGRMYFLTYGGLSMYDGARFRNYTTEQGLGNDLVNDIMEIGNDSLLIGVNAPTLNLLTKGVITKVKTKNNFCPLINQFLKSKDGHVYVSTDDGLYEMIGTSFEKIPLKDKADSKSAPEFLGTLLEFDQYLIFGCNDLRNLVGLYVYDKINRKITDRIDSKQFFFLGSDLHHDVWVKMIDGVYALDSVAMKNGKIKFIRPSFLPDLAEANFGSAMAFHDQNIWMMGRMNSLVSFSSKGVNFEIGLPTEAGSSVVKSIFIDRENSTWICYEGAGVFKLATPRVELVKKFTAEGTAFPLFHATNFNEETWFSTPKNNVVRRNASGSAEFSYNIQGTVYIFARQGNELLAYNGKKIFTAQIPEPSSVRIHFEEKIAFKDSNSFGKNILIDRYGNFVTATQDALMVWKDNQPIFSYPISQSDAIEGLSFDPSGRLWMVTRYADIVGFTLHPETPAQYLSPVRFPRNPITISPRSLAVDRHGLLWVGSRFDGLVVYKPDGNSLTKVAQFKIGNGLTDNFITSIVCDTANNIVIGTPTGLDRLVAEKNGGYRIENLTKSNNLYVFVLEVWCELGNKIFALTNTGAILEVLPSQSMSRHYQPGVLLQELKVNGQSVSLGKNVFGYDENNVGFSIAAPSFIDEKQIKFSYLLENASKGWSDTTTANSTINLINVPAGKYKLRVKAFFLSTSYEPAEMVYSFEIKPPWWQTWQFRFGISILIIAGMVLIVRYYYSRKLDKQKTLLEKQQAVVKERTRIATDMHDDLGAGLSRIKFLSETIGLKKQQQLPVEEDISSIRQYAHDMIDKMGEIVWALNEKNDSISDLLSYTRAYASGYLSQEGVGCSINVPDEFPIVFVSGEFRRNIYLSVKEALHNIIKHARASFVTITITIADNLLIVIADNGTGFDPLEIRPYSNGLANIKKRMADINGTAIIESNKGTTIRLSAPLPA